jgi:hypothetical protein
LCGEQQQDVGIAGLHLLAREVEADLGGAFEGARRSQRILLQLGRIAALSRVKAAAADSRTAANVLGQQKRQTLIQLKLCRR